MRKGRKPKGKSTRWNDESEKGNSQFDLTGKSDKFKKRIGDSILGANEDYFDEISYQGGRPISVNINSNMPESETNSITERSENNFSSKYQVIYDKSREVQVSRSNLTAISGPLTRRKEHQIFQSTSQRNLEGSLSELTTLKKFDDYFKDRKNIDNEIYYYRTPRVDPNLYQVYITAKPEDNDLINYFPNVEKIIDYDKISKEDLSYYLKFISYYKVSSEVSNGNLFLKGVHNFEEKSLLLLKESNYNINLALKKILFPLLDILGTNMEETSESPGSDEQEKNVSLKDPIVYVNSALNDLIGSNIQEKEQWIHYVYDRLSSRIEFSEMQQLIDLANKMKIDIPDFVIQEIEKSLAFAKVIRRHLGEKNTIKEISKLVELSENYKIRTEEFSQLEEIVRKAESWLKKVNEFDNTTINYKVLQVLYNEGKSLPVNFEGNRFENIKNRYLLAHQWQNNYALIPKHSKTRHGNSNKVNSNERCSIKDLEYLIDECDKINFTSNEVLALKTNYEKLIETEARIMMTLEDDLAPKTKELLTEFVNSLDCLRFTTDLFDFLVSKVEFYEWQETKDFYMSSKSFRVKHLRNLMKLANQKQLNDLKEIKTFKHNYDRIEKWMEIMSYIFFSDDENTDEAIESNGEDREVNCSNLNKLKTPKINESDLRVLYEEGKSFPEKPEEIEHLLSKCEEVFEFVEECRKAVNITDVSNMSYDYNKLSLYRDQILKYNIKCEEFEAIDTQIGLVHKWIEMADNFIVKFNTIEKDWRLSFKELSSLEVRQEMVEMLEAFLKRNTIFYENLMELIGKVPQFAQNLEIYLNLVKIKETADHQMNAYSSNFTDLRQLEELILESHKLCVRKSFFAQLLCQYRSKSWARIASLNNKMSLIEADMMIKEAANLGFETNEVEELKLQINKTKEWIKQSKKIINSDKISYESLKAFIKEGTLLPLHTQELEDLFSFQASMDSDIFQARIYLQYRSDYDEFSEFADKISKFSVEVEEFDLVFKIKAMCDEWKLIAEKILSSRKLCQLFFKQNKSDINKIKIKNVTEAEQSLTFQDNTPMTEDSNVRQSINTSTNLFSNNKAKKKHRESEIESEFDYMATPNKRQRKDSKCSGSSNEYYNKIENANINIINNNYYFNGQSITPSKTKNTKKEYENVLHMIKTIPSSNKDKKVKPADNNLGNIAAINNVLDKINLKKFNSYSYEEKLNIISQTVILRNEDENEHYCICRKGDDSVNYMLMCENCKEWFHGKCLKIQQSTADKISQYICIACSKRKDVYNNSVHYEFFNYKRISLMKFQEFCNEAHIIPVVCSEMEKIQILSQKIQRWKENYIALMQDINERTSLGVGHRNLPEQIEKNILDLYMESEGFPVEIENAANLIVILKHFDWFKDAYKCIENKKFSEKINRKVLSSSFHILNRELLYIQTDEEKVYFDRAIDRGLRLLLEISTNYEKYTTIFNTLKPNYDKKTLEILEELIPQMETGTKKGTQQIIDEVTEYIKWTNSVRIFLSSPSNVTEDNFKQLTDQSKTFNFKSNFIEKFRLIAKNFMPEQYEYYRFVLFDEGSKKSNKSAVVSIKKIPRSNVNNVSI